MRQGFVPGIVGLAAVVVAGCNASGSGLVVGREGAGGGVNGGGRSGAAGTGGAGFGTDASASRSFSAHLEHRQTTVDVVTVSCSEPCADVVAVATGGYAPYTFAWDDGSTNAARQVCPTTTTQYHVTVTDGGTREGEFPRGPKAVTVSLTANVLPCADAGNGTQDSGPPPVSDPCILNPSFEGTPGVNPLQGPFSGAPWVTCDGTPDIWNEAQAFLGTPPSSPKPANGATYLGLYVGDPNLIALETVTERLCAPLQAGKTYSLKMDLANQTAIANGVPGILELWAGSAACAEDQMLWASPVLSSGWQTYCVTFTMARALDYLKFKPRYDGANTSGVFIDHLVPVAGCN